MSVSILIVDDEPDVAELFRQSFRREMRQGLYVLHFAYSAEEALQMVAEGIRPELIVILSDINMPGMDGLALLGEIKKTRPELPVMMVTAYGDEERRRRASEHGAAKFITKPVDFDFLKQQLRQLPRLPARGVLGVTTPEDLAVDDEANFRAAGPAAFTRSFFLVNREGPVRGNSCRITFQP
jgi:CheY-like chemotaxis protein